MVTDFDRDNIRSIMADRPGFDWFTANLLRLLLKADSENREKIRTVFPDVVELFEQYKNGDYSK
jgi:hypothetical protein